MAHQTADFLQHVLSIRCMCLYCNNNYNILILYSILIEMPYHNIIVTLSIMCSFFDWAEILYYTSYKYKINII